MVVGKQKNRRELVQRLSQVEQLVVATVAYCDQFDFPLTAEEVWQRLPAYENSAELFGWNRKKVKNSRPGEATQGNILSRARIRAALAAMVKKKILQERAGYYFLIGRASEVTTRQRRHQIFETKRGERNRLFGVLTGIPWIQGIFLTGSAAMKNADESDDLDVMVVTSPRRLWLTRLVVTLVAMVFGKRRSWHGEEPRSWCFNLWLDDQHLAVPPAKRSIYQAYEVVQAECGYDRVAIQEEFYRANSWVKTFLPNALSVKNGRAKNVSHPRLRLWSSQRILGVSEMLDGLDWLAWRFQEWYMNPHRTTEHTGRGFAFFHPRDTRGLVEKRWRKSLHHPAPYNECSVSMRK